MGRLLVCAALVAAWGCGGHKGKSEGPEPIPECEEYGRALSVCLHRNVPFAAQSAVLPKSEEDRTRIQETCASNLRRLKVACR